VKHKKVNNTINYAEQLRLLKKAGLSGRDIISQSINPIDDIENLDDRIKNILSLINNAQKSTNMLYIIMYDIENNKIRKYIAKYLLQKGCIRIQKSVFLASSERKNFEEITNTLKEVNEVYENKDSIMLVPISTDELKSMRIIGQEKDLKLYTNKPNTIIF